MTPTFALLLALSSPASDPSGVSAPADPALRPADQSLQTAVSASNAFGVDLFKALAQKAPSGNVLLSPYSMSMALTMVAEGARDQTEKEMAAVLHYPKAAGAARAVTSVHEGFAALDREWTEARGNTDPATAAKIAELRSALDAANTRSRDSERSNNWQEAQRAHAEAVRLAGELNALLVSVDRFDLRIANALWVQRAYPLSPAYTETIDRFYGSGSATSLDIASDPEGSRKRINDWAEDHTEHRIKDLIPPGALSAVTRLVVTNAIYFKGQWAAPFAEGNTRDEKFTGPTGSATDVRMMNDSWRGSASYAAFMGNGDFFNTPTEVPVDAEKRPPTYPDDAGFQALQVPYKGGDLAMVFLLPRTTQGLPALEQRLDAKALDTWLGKLTPRTVDTGIPRFKMGFDAEMSAPLQALGMRRAFVSPDQAGGAQFPGMTTATDVADQLFIASVLHKTWIEVAEKGTEAAAATAVLMAPGAAVAPEPPKMIPFIPQFRANHPFLFLIRDTKSGAILFLGRVTNPG